MKSNFVVRCLHEVIGSSETVTSITLHPCIIINNLQFVLSVDNNLSKL